MQGTSVAISADGNTVACGAKNEVENGTDGAVYIFVRSGTTWTQQGNVFAGGALGNTKLGTSVAISLNGNVMVSGAPGDDGAWEFERVDSIWSQVRSMLQGSNDTSYQGTSIAMDGVGSTIAFGAPFDPATPTTGSIWVFTCGPTASPTQSPTSSPSLSPTLSECGVLAQKVGAMQNQLGTLQSMIQMLLPTVKPSTKPTTKPTARPTRRPSRQPTKKPAVIGRR